MARIAGINIPMNKHVWVGLTHVYGVGKNRSKAVCTAAGVNPHTKVKDLTETEVNAIRSQIAKFASIARERSLSVGICNKEDVIILRIKAQDITTHNSRHIGNDSFQKVTVDSQRRYCLR